MRIYWCKRWEMSDPYDPYEWQADTIHRRAYRKDNAEGLRPFRRVQSFLAGKVSKVRWYVAATGL